MGFGERRGEEFVLLIRKGEKDMNETGIKSIEQLIKYLNEKYPMSYDSTNYGKELASMKEMKIASSIVRKCKNIKKGIKESPYNFRNDNMLWSYLNKCIIECYENNYDPSLKTFCDAYINVRKLGNENNIKQRLIEIAKDREINVAESCRKIDEAWENYFHYMQEIKKYPWNTNGYYQILHKMKAIGKFLIDKNYVHSLNYWEMEWQSIECDVFYDYCKEKEEEEKRKEEEIKEKEQERIAGKNLLFFWGGIIGLILLIWGIVSTEWVFPSILVLVIIITISVKLHDWKNK